MVFNILMLIWLIGSLSAASHLASQASSDTEAAGTIIGGTFGIGLLIGLFTLSTHGNTVIITEEQK